MNKTPQFRIRVLDDNGQYLNGTKAASKIIRLRYGHLWPEGHMWYDQPLPPGDYHIVEETAGSPTPLYQFAAKQ